nr:MAG TPA: hypothetical protein [Caudoviricetes sp.]
MVVDCARAVIKGGHVEVLNGKSIPHDPSRKRCISG